MLTLSDIGEDALIERLIQWVPRDPAPTAGPGDDCAVVDCGGNSLLLLKTDALVGGIHFLPEESGRRVGWKAAARVVSDFAAMGGKPERFLVTLALPANTEVFWVEELYRGIGNCLRNFHAVLSGGETSSVPLGSAPCISIAATGSVQRENLVLRSTGREGDILLVTGELGGSLLGKHLDFTPRIEQAAWLVSHFKPTAMMDLSDGLAKDLPRLAKASGCGFALEREKLPASTGCTAQQALSDGEDYELLLAMEPEKVPELLTAWASAFPELPLTKIGHLVSPEKSEELIGGWEHFAAGERKC